MEWQSHIHMSFVVLRKVFDSDIRGILWVVVVVVYTHQHHQRPVAQTKTK